MHESLVHTLLPALLLSCMGVYDGVTMTAWGCAYYMHARTLINVVRGRYVPAPHSCVRNVHCCSHVEKAPSLHSTTPLQAYFAWQVGCIMHGWMDGGGAACNGRALLALHIMNFCIRSAMEPVVHNFMQVMHASHRPLSVSFQQLVSHQQPLLGTC